MADTEDPIILGTEEAVLQGVREFLSPWENDRRVVVYEGCKESIEKMAALVAASGYEVSADYSRPVARMEYEIGLDDGSANNSGESWEMRGNDISKKLASHPEFDGLEDQLAEIDQVFNGTHASFKGTKEKSAIQVYIEAKSPLGAALDYIGHRSRGVDSYIEAGYRIIHSIITSSKSTIEASDANVMRVESPAVPSSAKFSLPDGEWLKKAPQVIDMGHGRFKITSEWIWAEQWSKLLYGGTWEPTVS